jgi:hypothetical protein
MSAVHTLLGTRYSAAGNKTGESEVTLGRGGAEPTLADDILLTIGNRSIWVDATALRHAVLALTNETDAAPPGTDDGPVHLRHSLDGYPLCWPQDRDGDFDGTRATDAVTCLECRSFLNEDNE